MYKDQANRLSSSNPKLDKNTTFSHIVNKSISIKFLVRDILIVASYRLCESSCINHNTVEGP